MSKLQVREGRARKSEEVGAENGQQQEIRFMRLEDIPIEDALHEKEVFEKGDFAHKLNPKHSSGPVILSDDARRRRIVEVYKRCFQEADLPAGPKVVSDFIAHFPRLIFDADWLKEELIRVDHTLPDLGDQRKKGKKEILQAIAKGFRRAASSNLRKPATEQYYRVSGTRIAMRTFQDELMKWNETLREPLPTPKWIEAQAGEKADELIKTNSKLGRRDRPRLTRLLQQGQCYKAAVLIASKVFGVRERDLQQKSD